MRIVSNGTTRWILSFITRNKVAGCHTTCAHHDDSRLTDSSPEALCVHQQSWFLQNLLHASICLSTIIFHSTLSSLLHISSFYFEVFNNRNIVVKNNSLKRCNRNFGVESSRSVRQQPSSIAWTGLAAFPGPSFLTDWRAATL
jgi:hypothetical protein